MNNVARRAYYWLHRTAGQLEDTVKRDKSRKAALAWKDGIPKRQRERKLMGLIRQQSIKLSPCLGRGELAVMDIAIPEFCPLLGLRLSFSSDCTSPNQPSLDRINSALGYVKGNVQVVSLRANLLKRDATLEEMISLGAWAKNFG